MEEEKQAPSKCIYHRRVKGKSKCVKRNFMECVLVGLYNTYCNKFEAKGKV